MRRTFSANSVAFRYNSFPSGPILARPSLKVAQAIPIHPTTDSGSSVGRFLKPFAGSDRVLHRVTIVVIVAALDGLPRRRGF